MKNQPGALILPEGCTFKVWAPLRKQIEVHVIHPFDMIVPMIRDNAGYWSATIKNIGHGASYFYRLDNEIERADPASQCQPDGVHGSSMVIDHTRYTWNDGGMCRRKLIDYIIYELHVGTFTSEGTFNGAIERIPDLVKLGITAVEIMPVAQFPGERNWGYDGVYPFAIQHCYGGVEDFKSFVNECHRNNLAVILDVVYNHLGPEGNYLRDFGPYFTDRYKTPWGDSLNFDGPYSDDVCHFFISNACYWLSEFHIDTLRLDAIHAICDIGAQPFLQRLSQVIYNEFGTGDYQKYLIAESDLNDVRVIRERSSGGFGFHAQWSDDFHHSLHTVLTGEKLGYYADFGEIGNILSAMKSAFCYYGNYSIARKRSHGNDASSFDSVKFVVCSQNHDQIGNRMLGERLISLTGLNQARLAAAVVILSPYIPLLFMGEEHGEDNPFLYFADHTDDWLKSAVREGRKTEFADFHDIGAPPDPFDSVTFEKSRPDWNKQSGTAGSSMLHLYKELIRIRTVSPAIGPRSREYIEIMQYPQTSCITIHYHHHSKPALCIFNFSNQYADVSFQIDGHWQNVLDSGEHSLENTYKALPPVATVATSLRLMPFGFAVYERE